MPLDSPAKEVVQLHKGSRLRLRLGQQRNHEKDARGPAAVLHALAVRVETLF